MSSRADYAEAKALVAQVAEQTTHQIAHPHHIRVTVNTAADPAAGRLYLSTSAEAGDDGEAGRGNRMGGLITPGRPMTLEAAAGKNTDARGQDLRHRGSPDRPGAG